MTYRSEFKEGEREARWTFGRILIWICALSAIFTVIGFGLGWFNEAATVAKKEYGPQGMLDKYNWFINQSNAIKKMDNDVVLFRKRANQIDSTYGPIAKMDAITKELYANKKANAESDLVAIISQRNNLVKEYNSQSEKFTWEPFNTKSDKPAYKFDLVDP